MWFADVFGFRVEGFFLFHGVSLGLEDGAGSPNPDLAIYFLGGLEENTPEFLVLRTG